MQTSAVIGGLRPDTEYQVQIAAYNRKGDGERSRPRRIKTKATKEMILGAPRQLKLVAMQSSPPSVSVAWQPPLGAESTSLEYKIEWGRTDHCPRLIPVRLHI